METYHFLDDNGTFTLKNPELCHSLYFPIASEKGLKSVVTPILGGDSKIDQNTFLLEPTSIENLHNNRNTRNFWCKLEGENHWSAVGSSAEAEANIYSEQKDECEVTAGFMWHKISRASSKYKLKSEVTSFVPWDDNVEIMQVVITNTGDKAVTMIPIAAIPIYGRSADNLRDHRHVTSLLHRISTTENGVYVKPTLSFDERGHQINQQTYFVCGVTGEKENPESFYPTVESFIGDAGTYTNPYAVARDIEGVKAGYHTEGAEVIGAIRFSKVILEPNMSKTYLLLLGTTTKEAEISGWLEKYGTQQAVEASLEATKAYWTKKVNIQIRTGNKNFDNYMRWVCLQPFLRRIYGCSFVPHHDYAKGGRGWRDLWQDCLALLIMDPTDVRQMILDNFAGVRMDGSNATIIGSKQGEFIADRNHITRVWMDHGMWPFLTTKLYMEQTGDLEILLEKAYYFKDRQIKRGTAVDENWNSHDGSWQKTITGAIYEGTLLEHILLQHVCAMLETGAHGKIRLRGADWNDAIDMAQENGESVAFTCAYAGNLLSLSQYLHKLETNCQKESLLLLEEFAVLLKNIEDGKKDAIDVYQNAVSHCVKGHQVEVSISWLADFLSKMGQEMIDQIRKEEWITDQNKTDGWYNSYYDNHSQAVEGFVDGKVRMMLTGQVFAIMSTTATDEQVKAICHCADKYLFEEKIGGYRLNTNFQEEKYDMGRMFGFAYGEKENGAVFSHMTVMYAYALYSRGYAKEGYKALQTLANTALNYSVSKIYPGIPEYFNSKGQGLYHYLTGAASWYDLTMVTEVFGVKGAMGQLHLEPKLMACQFDENKEAMIRLTFADTELEITYRNENRKEYGQYTLGKCYIDDELYEEGNQKNIVIERKDICNTDKNYRRIVVELI